MMWEQAKDNIDRCEILLESMDEYDDEYLTVMEPEELAFVIEILKMSRNIFDSGVFRNDAEKMKIETFERYHQYIKSYKYDEDAVDDDITLLELVDIHDEYEKEGDLNE